MEQLAEYIMTEKNSQKTVGLDNTKMTSLIHYRSAEMSDATIILRKEEYLKKKLKAAYEANSLLEKQIKQNEVEIKDERASINFQLSDLIKELGGKFNCFVEEKLERGRFRTSEIFHESIQQMMQKYEKIEEECELLKKIITQLEDIAGKYQNHSKGMEELVMSLEVTNREYEDNMENSLNDINEQIKAKIRENENTQLNTHNLVKEIDGFVEGAITLKEDEMKLLGKIEKMKKMAMRQQEKVDQIKEWAEIVIDKNNRKLVYKTMNEKRDYLQKIKAKNDLLEMYLNQLQAQQCKMIKQDKQNTIKQKKTPKKETTMRKSNMSHSKYLK